MGQARNQRQDGVRTVDAAAIALAAGTFGGLGSLAANAVIGAVLAHSHAAAHGVESGVRHVHDRDTAVAVVLACLLATAAAAAVAALTRGVDHRAPRWSSGLAIASFTAWELLISGGADGFQSPSPLLLLAGAAVHTAVGAAAGLLCWRWLHGLNLAPRAPRRRAEQPWPHAVPRGDRCLRRRWWTPARGGRAPPASRA